MGRLFRHGIVDYTNERALEALADGSARDGDVHVAEAQTRGRGRRGRVWASPHGEGLYLSAIHFSPSPPPPAPTLTMAAGLAVVDALGHLVPDLRLDWPNDVVVGKAKLAGILVEARGLGPDRPGYVIGIGINVGMRSVPEDLHAERAVTSLALEGVSISRVDVLDRLLPPLSRRLADTHEAPARLAEDYLRATRLEEREVRVAVAGEERFGRLLEVDPTASELVLGTRSGEVRLALAHVSEVEPVAASL